MLINQENSRLQQATVEDVFGMIKEVPHPKVGSVKLVGGGVNLSDTPTEIKTPAPLHGEHTDEILARIGAKKDGAAT